MKSKIFLLIALLFALAVTFIAFQNSNSAGIAGVIQKVKLNTNGSDTISNSISKTGYIEFDNQRIVDSVQFTTYCIGEIDVDKLVLLGAFVINDAGYKTYAIFTTTVNSLDTTSLTTDLDSADSGIEFIGTIPGSELRGMNGIYCQVDAASSGCDATDPNKLQLYANIFYRPQ